LGGGGNGSDFPHPVNVVKVNMATASALTASTRVNLDFIAVFPSIGHFF
jgi:hypothetical protein